MSIYLDNAATSFPKPESVYQAVDNYQRNIGVNPGRGSYRRAEQAQEIIVETRKLLSQLFNIETPARIVFTANVTEALNLTLKGLLQEGDHVITSQLEHNAMWRPLKRLERERNIDLTAIPCLEGSYLDVDQIEKAICPETKLVALNHASNVTGAILPIKEVGDICRQHQIPLLVDTAQTAGVYPIDVQRLNIDLLAFTGHKGLLGPTGTGGLYINSDIELQPLKEGGTGGDSLLERQPDYLPNRFEAGTHNIVGIAGLRAAVKFILEESITNIRAHEQELTSYMLDYLQQIPGLKIYGPAEPERQVAVISFNLEEIPPEEAAYVLDEVYEIMVRAGLHCAPPAHRCIGTVNRGTVRISFNYFNTKEDCQQLYEALCDLSNC
ncbi:aminotransferase class V-fold PLP-dependent enzyme [Acetohalobium arabaticum]|uniref:cysteine desulfurase n=1 Tax=Acetohalobium arabaticum (strain ATCC 49924 / DSM 5501 / Z-7288) TaxID=574087 RepID=D9QT22_ACEAZ|nr:aminotransferase class V-fold PLP-dependent enzyme [Acetohalobium arabaticum]ADL13522.1 cysteine desulfurase family protein [Acetohalobium arabaticum DSM 5501]